MVRAENMHHVGASKLTEIGYRTQDGYGTTQPNGTIAIDTS